MASPMNPALTAAYEDFDPGLVEVNDKAISELALPAGLKGIGGSLEGELGQDPDLFIPYIVAMNPLNFQFFDVQANGDFVRYEHGGKVGALAMQDAFLGAWQFAMQGLEHLTSRERSLAAASRLLHRIEAEGIPSVFGPIPAPQKRLNVLRESLEPERLRAATVALRARLERHSALGWTDAVELGNAFQTGYADRYLKKAQLTMMFLGGQWKQATGNHVSLDVTAAADYQLPKVLRALGLLIYSPEVAATVDAGGLIARDSAKERAIRAATILACDQLRVRFQCLIEEVDFWLWLNRNADKTALFHRTLTTDY